MSQKPILDLASPLFPEQITHTPTRPYTHTYHTHTHSHPYHTHTHTHTHTHISQTGSRNKFPAILPMEKLFVHYMNPES